MAHRNNHQDKVSPPPRAFAVLALVGPIVAALSAGPQPRLALAQAPASATVDSVVVVAVPADSAETDADSTKVQDVHPQDSPADRGFMILNRASGATLRVFGSVRLHGGYDVNGLQNSDYFETYLIPVGAATESQGRFFMDVTQTRLGMESRNPSSLGDVLMRIEGDFRSSTKTMRLVHAYGTVRRILAGLTWSTFGDPASIPTTVDVIGPNSAVGERSIQIRWSDQLSETLKWSLAIETNTPEFSQPDTVVTEPAYQNIPNLAGRLKRSGPWGHVQVAGVFRGFTANTVASGSQHLLGAGGLVSGRAVVDPEDEFLFQFAGGQAIARYVAGVAGRGEDAAYDPGADAFVPLPIIAWQLSYGHQLKPGLRSYASAGLVRVFERGFQPGNAFSRSSYVSANAMWIPSPGLRTGIEYSWGRRQDKNGQSGNANRVSFCLYYDY